MSRPRRIETKKVTGVRKKVMDYLAEMLETGVEVRIRGLSFGKTVEVRGIYYSRLREGVFEAELAEDDLSLISIKVDEAMTR